MQPNYEQLVQKFQGINCWKYVIYETNSTKFKIYTTMSSSIFHIFSKFYMQASFPYYKST